MVNGKNITNDKLYDALTGMRLELKSDITRLESKFDTLEAGRLTRAEGHINDLRLELQKAITTFTTDNDANKVVQASLSTKFVIIGAIGSAILLGVAQALFTKWIK